MILGIVLVKPTLWRDKKNELIKNARAVATICSSSIWELVTYIAFYPKMVAFGANPTFDYAAVFGFFQVGSSKITADMLKVKE